MAKDDPYRSLRSLPQHTGEHYSVHECCALAPTITSDMDRRKFLKAATVALSCATLSACAKARVTLRYRLRIVVQVAERLYEGSSVVETELAYFGDKAVWWKAPEAGSMSFSSWGEAVALDLGEHGLLFGLLYPVDGRVGGFYVNSAGDMLFTFLPNDRRGTAERMNDLPGLQGEFPVRESSWPTLVRFRDISDPTTFEVVDRGQFAAIYGPGSSVTSVTISITHDPITRGIDKVLPWLAGARTVRRTGYLSAGHFKIDGR
jgi:hypothetical protein